MTQTPFERIAQEMSCKFPKMTPHQLKEDLRQLRAVQGTLHGHSVDSVVEALTEMLNCDNAGAARIPIADSFANDNHSTSFSSSSGYSQVLKPMAKPPPGFETEPVVPPVNLSMESRLSSEEEPCQICLESLRAREVTKTSCDHQFHKECLRRWLDENKTCPVCRDYNLLEDDYPSLPTNNRRRRR